MSDEFSALLATTQLERSKADGINSLIAASKLAARYQHRAEVAEAALARVYVLASRWEHWSDVSGAARELRAAMKEPTS